MRFRCAALVFAVVLAACGSGPTRHTETLREEIAKYERADAGASEERIAALFAQVDADVAALRAEELAKPAGERAELTRRREALAAERRELQAVYVRARVARLGVAAEEALRGLTDQLGRGLEDMGRTLRREEAAP